MSMFKRVAANSEVGQKLAEQLVETGGRTNYNEVAREYNATPVGDFLQFPWEKEKASTIVQQLSARSVNRDQDYTIAFALQDGVENAFIKRLSETAATFVIGAKRGPRKASAVVVETPAVETPAATETPAPKAGKSKG